MGFSFSHVVQRDFCNLDLNHRTLTIQCFTFLCSLYFVYPIFPIHILQDQLFLHCQLLFHIPFDCIDYTPLCLVKFSSSSVLIILLLGCTILILLWSFLFIQSLAATEFGCNPKYSFLEVNPTE